MFDRNILKELQLWLEKPDRKPLVLRGARQVGKTTVVRELGKQCKQFIYLNLELEEDRKPFEQFTNVHNWYGFQGPSRWAALSDGGSNDERTA